MRLDDAIDYARCAVALCERTGITLDGSISKALLAFFLLEQPAPIEGDRILARRMLDEAEGWASEHGTKNLLGLNVMARSLLSEQPTLAGSSLTLRAKAGVMCK